jgi:hypothetical protein
VPQY